MEPGVLLMELSAYVEDHDFFYPPDPGEKSATIGGNISTNAGGMRAVKYGVTRDYVMGLEVVLPDGTITQFGGKVVKNSSGYDLKDLIIGSEGTLGFITKAILKLLPLPKRVISLLIPFPTLKQAIDTVPVIIKSKTIPTAIEFMQREVIEDAEEYLGKAFPDKQSDAYLLLKFDGNSTQEIEETYDKVAKLCLEQGALDVLISDTQEREESIWKARGAFLEAIKGSTTYMDEVDMVVPKSTRESTLAYNEFEKLGEDRDYFYLFRDSYGGYMVPKKGIDASAGSRSNSDESQNLKAIGAFREFLENKSGKRIYRKTIPLVRVMQALKKKR